jgi:FkbM family methyltransferase
MHRQFVGQEQDVLRRAVKGIIHAYLSLAKRLETPPWLYMRFEALARSQDFALVHNGSETFVVLTADRTISRAVFVSGEFEFATFTKVLSLLRTDRVATLVDIGANIGTICIPALVRGLAGAAWAIEPEPRNYRALTANVYLNSLEDRVKLLNLACGSRDETLQFELSPDNSGDHRIRISTETGTYGEATRKITSVQSRRLDDIVPILDPNSTLVWMDVQGFEGHVLSGATRVLASGVPVVLEFWPYGMKRTQCYPLVRSSLGSYKSFYDLSEAQPRAMPLSEQALDKLYEGLGEGGKHTDLLLVPTAA